MPGPESRSPATPAGGVATRDAAARADPGALRPWVRWLGLAAVVAGLGYLARLGAHAAAALPHLRWDGPALLGFGWALLLYLATLASSGVAWYLLLRAGGERPPLGAVIAVSLVAQGGKYLPGNVAQYLGRVVLARRLGLTLPHLLLTLGEEIACAVLAGLAFAAATSPATARVPPPTRLAAGALLAVAGLEGGARLLASRRLRARLHLPPDSAPSQVVSEAAPMEAASEAARSEPAPSEAPAPFEPAPRTQASPPPEPTEAAEPAPPGTRRPVWLACLALYSLNFLLFAAAGSLLARRQLGAAPVSLTALAGLFAAAWVAGFLTPGAPAGLGVREAVLAGGLGSLYAPGVAFALPLLFRLLTLTGDGLGCALGWLLGGTRALPAPAAEAPH